jgi:hypothetical protein
MIPTRVDRAARVADNEAAGSAIQDSEVGALGGLSLASGRAERTDAAHVITLALGGSRGRLWELERVTSGAQVDMRRGSEFEPRDEQATPSGDGRLLRYAIEDLPDGLFVAENTGGEDVVYFEVVGGEVRRIFDGEQQVRRELRRR